MARKKKKTLTDAEIAQAVADAAEQVERGGRSSVAFILKVDSSVLRPQRGQRRQRLCQLIHLQRLQRRQRSSQSRLHRVVAQDVREFR
jgi:hypothetical protein